MSTTTKIVVAVLVALAVGIGIDLSRADSRIVPLWQQAVKPGGLSQSHAFLSNECAACHTPVKGVEPTLCISCHADNTALLQRQPTAFHANVQVCSGCHLEHQGTFRMPTTMDHSLLATVGHQQIKASEVDGLPRRDTQAPTPGASDAGMSPPGARESPADHSRSKADQSMLDCASCHASKDRHQGLLGADCVQCHATTQWTIAEFVHPSARSTECAQCHLPPPSHNMMHFSMMSAPLARQPDAKVNQCFMCHQTTAWNDIKGVGRVKHH